jgi:hypothetical protein
MAFHRVWRRGWSVECGRTEVPVLENCGSIPIDLFQLCACNSVLQFQVLMKRLKIFVRV